MTRLTEGQTDGNPVANAALHSMQSGKKIEPRGEDDESICGCDPCLEAKTARKR